MKAKEENPNKIGAVKFWGWQTRAVSLGCLTIVLTYLMIYCTDTLGLDSKIVGMLLLASKVLDGITDLFAGYLIDNTKTRFGKARPYELCIIALWLCTWLLFSCPAGMATTVKYIWVFIFYVLVNSVFSTFLNCNQNAYMVRAFPNMNQIVKLNSYGGIVVTLGCAIVSMILPTAISSMATSASGWSKMMFLFAMPLALIGILRFVFVKETVQVEDTSDKLKISDMIQILKKNRYQYIILAVYVLYNSILGMSASTYYFTWVVGDLSKYTMIAALSMPLMLVMFLFPAMMKKMRLSRIVMLGAACGAVGYAINFVAAGSLPLLMIAGALYGFGGYPIAYVGGLMILDCAEYNSLIGLPRAESTVTAFQSCGSKIGNGVGSAVLGFLLSAGGYVGTASTQTAGALMTIRCLYSIIPAALFALIFIILHFYTLEKKLPELRANQNGK